MVTYYSNTHKFNILGVVLKKTYNSLTMFSNEINLYFILFIKNFRFLRLNHKNNPISLLDIVEYTNVVRIKLRIHYTIQYYAIHLRCAYYTGIFLHIINKYY